MTNLNPTVDIESTTSEESRSINMEQNRNSTTASAKKFWRMVQAIYIMLRKGISKGKLMMDLKLMMIKRNNKLTSKVHRFSSAISSAVHHRTHDHDYPDFHHLPHFYLKTNNKTHENDLELEVPEAAPASPVLPGFGKTPMVRQLRITDSPFPLSGDVITEEESHIDEAAEEFIIKFYKDLRRRNAMSSDS